MLIGISGYGQAGKDVIGSCLVRHFGFTRLSLADPLKDLVYDINPEVAEMVDIHGWDIAKTKHPFVREALIDVGVGARKNIGADVWLGAMVKKMKPGVSYTITDVRFPNEYKFCRQFGEVWRVDRLGVGPAHHGDSENIITDYEFDRTFNNYGSTRDLCDSVADQMYQINKAEAYEGV